MKIDRGEKHPHLAVYDYGMGGSWVVVNARTNKKDHRIAEKRSFDIDDEPTGWLLTLIQER
jgi:hypothetical protein